MSRVESLCKMEFAPDLQQLLESDCTSTPTDPNDLAFALNLLRPLHASRESGMLCSLESWNRALSLTRLLKQHERDHFASPAPKKSSHDSPSEEPPVPSH